KVNSLAQLTLRMTVPGFPDTYQGTELWDDSLVDPDNRRPVDFALRRELLSRARQTTAGEAWGRESDSGLPKLLLLDRLLHPRHRRPHATPPECSCEPVAVGDSHAIAFLRGGEVAVVVPRLTMTGDRTTEIALPAGEWRDVVSDHAIVSRGSVSVAILLAEFP